MKLFVVREGRFSLSGAYLQLDGSWGPLKSAVRYRLWATADRIAQPLGGTPCQLRPPMPPLFMDEWADSGCARLTDQAPQAKARLCSNC